MRYLGSLTVGIVVALLLFLLMHSLISNKETTQKNTGATQIVDFVRVQRDDQTQTKSRNIPKKPPPPKSPPPPPDVQVSADQKVQAPQLDVNIPRVNVPVGGAGGGGPFLGGYAQNMNAGEGDVIPIVQIQPQWPRRALMEGISGWVKVEFTILPDGSVEDPSVVESKPGHLFDSSAIRAILRWKFKPRIVDGRAVKRRATQVIEFKINKDQQG